MMNRDNLYKSIDESGLTSPETLEACRELENEAYKITINQIIEENKSLKKDLMVKDWKLQLLHEKQKELDKKLRRIKELAELVVMLNEVGMESKLGTRIVKNYADAKEF